MHFDKLSANGMGYNACGIQIEIVLSPTGSQG